MHLFMDGHHGHHMFFIYGTLIIVIRYSFICNIISYENLRSIKCFDILFCIKMIQVDIRGHPHFPNGSKQFSGHFGNLLFLAGFHFRGQFEGLNEVFSRSRFSTIDEGMIEPPK
jgi:hypothetical protein